MSHVGSRGRGRCRGRGRGRARGAKLSEQDPSGEMGVESIVSEQSCKKILSPGRPAEDCSELQESLKENVNPVDGADPCVRNFDLNTGLDDNNRKTTTAGDTTDITSTTATATAPIASTAEASDIKVDKPPELSELDRMVIDPLQVAQMNSRLDDDDEDYDEEG